MLIGFTLVLMFMLGACGDDDDDADGGSITVSDAWSRPAVLLEGAGDDEMESPEGDATAGEDSMDETMDMGGTNGVIYVTIENNSDVDDVLLSATTDVAGTAELHNVTMVEGVMQMRQVDGGIEVPAGETVVLEPGGLHVMLIGLTRSLEEGDTFDVDFEFEEAGEMTVEVEVREP